MSEDFLENILDEENLQCGRPLVFPKIINFLEFILDEVGLDSAGPIDFPENIYKEKKCGEVMPHFFILFKTNGWDI